MVNFAIAGRNLAARPKTGEIQAANRITDVVIEKA
jgi:hypothetical protein